MSLLDAFLPRLMPQVMGCSEPLAVQALLDSAIEFCEETNIVQVVTDPSPMAEGVSQYDIDLPSQTEVARVLKVWSGARVLTQIEPVTAENLLLYNSPVGAAVAVLGAPLSAVVEESGTVTVYPTPDSVTAANEMLSFRVAVKPTRSATSVPDELYKSWAEAVVSGALFRLASMNGQTFSSDKVAKAGFERYRYFVNRAHIEANRGRLAGPLGVRNRPLA
jgi:hypothetical protein